jgi:D-alanyl-D-alanine carboxypeptidase (penicillin-binding protein 5/6)
MMNEKAAELGCEKTVFSSPHGVISKNNKTTAKDFYKIYKYALSLPAFQEMAKSIRYTIPANNMHIESRTLVTRTYILDKYLGGEYYYEYATFGKSSGTGDAGRSLVSSATKGEINYTIVSFDAPMYDENDDYIKNIGSFTDHKKLYNWVFNGLKMTKVLSKEEMINEIKVTLSKSKDYVHLYPDKDYSVLLPTDVSVDSIQYVKNLPESIKAPVKKGEVAGTMTLRLNNEDLVTVNLVASDDVEADGIILSAYYVGVVLTSPWFLVPVILIAVGFIAFIIYVRVHHNNKRKYKTVKHRRRF